MREYKMTVENSVSPVAYTASGGAVLFGLNAMEIAAYVGAVVAVATFLVNWYYKAQALRVQKKLAEQGIGSESPD